MEQWLSQLRQCALFENLDIQTLEQEILPRGQLHTFPKGHFLLTPQQRMDHFAILLSGTIHAMHIFADGSYRIMDAQEPGEVFGADLMGTKSRICPYHAQAVQPVTLLSFPVEMVLQPGSLPEEIRVSILSQLLTIISHQNIRKEYRLAILSRKSLRERILTYLTMQADKRHTDTFSIPFSREELASYLCVNRSALSHELATMQQEGMIRFRKNTFTLLNRESEPLY